MKRVRTFWILIVTTLIVLCVLVYVRLNYYRIIEPKEDKCENYFDYFIQKIQFEQQKIQSTTNADTADLDFSFSDYFRFFDCLNVDSDWKIDYLITKNGLQSGRPIFFALPRNNNVDSLKARFEYDNIYNYCDSINLIEHIKVIDNEKGYYQLLIFDLIGDNFGRSWYTSIGWQDIICSKRMLRQIASRTDDIHNFDIKMRKKIKALDYNLIFKNLSDSVTYRFIVFNAWGGFREKCYSVHKQFPHKIALVKDSLLLYYDCGVFID